MIKGRKESIENVSKKKVEFRQNKKYFLKNERKKEKRKKKEKMMNKSREN